MPDFRYVLFLAALLLAIVGCDENEKQLRTWQQEQVAELNRQSQDNSAAARALVEADAESRRQFVALQESVQVERQELADQHSALDAERKSVAATREQIPLLATALQGLAALALGVAALWVCGRLLGALSTDDGADALEETMILSLAGESDLLAERPILLRPPEAAAAPSTTVVTDAVPAVAADATVP